VRRVLLHTKSFSRVLKRRLKRQPKLAAAVTKTLQALADDALNPNLKTHKLHGALADFWACNITQNLRILFKFVDHKGSEAILLHDLGTHDEVY
jgi:addiction module RelE/StbE family toxin